MAVRVGINGYGRIGRSFHRALLARAASRNAGDDAGVELVAVNDPFGDPVTMAFLLGHDSVGGPLHEDVEATGDGFTVGGSKIALLGEKDPAEIPWGDRGVDVVIESTGLFTSREGAAAHLRGGARKVVISAPSGDADVMVCMGVNHGAYDHASHDVISNASCTTNCLAPLARALHEAFTIEQGLMTTVHAYTSDQALQDLARPTRSGKPDLRRMRAAALSIIPSTTGAAKAIGKVLPELNGRLDGLAVRVPVPDGSLTDLVVVLSRETSVDEVNETFQKAAADDSYLGVLEYSDEELVSQDIVGSRASCIFSAPDTMASGTMVKVLGWYDNEFGYSNRLVDVVKYVGDQL